MDRYAKIPTKRNDANRLVHTTSLLPDNKPSANDIYVITTPGDRLDLLAYKYYGDTSYWWIIAQANTNTEMKKGSLVLDGGLQLRIPRNPTDVITEFENNNI